MRRGRPMAPRTLTQEEPAILEQWEIFGKSVLHCLFLPFRQRLAPQTRTDYLR